MPYRHTQTGRVMLFAFLIGIAFVVGALVRWDLSTVADTVLVTAGVILLACLFIFRRLSVTVDDEGITAAFGSGWPRTRIPLSEVTDVEAVRPHWVWGLGIRLIRDGWLWRIATGDAIKIARGNGKATLIGTDDAEGLLAAIESRLNADAFESV